MTETGPSREVHEYSVLSMQERFDALRKLKDFAIKQAYDIDADLLDRINKLLQQRLPSES